MSTYNPFTEISEALVEINRKLTYLSGGQSEQTDFIGIDEACKLLNLSKAAIYKLTMCGKIPYHKYAKKLIFSRIELQNFIKQHKNQRSSTQGIIIEGE